MRGSGAVRCSRSHHTDAAHDLAKGQAMLSKELLEILCCPKCKGDLEYKPDQETLTCTSCRTVYPVRNDIPIMLVDDENGRG